MSITINGTGTITGITAGGLPNGCIQKADLASDINTTTHYDCWRLYQSSVDEDEDPLGSVTAIERSIDANSAHSGFGTFGAPMTQSGGIFTFPEPGYWKIEFAAQFLNGNPSYNDDIRILATTDGGTTWEAVARSQGSLSDDGDNNVYSVNFCSVLVDVTDVGDVKVKFSVAAQDGAVTIAGNTDYNRTYMTFTRIGNT